MAAQFGPFEQVRAPMVSFASSWISTGKYDRGVSLRGPMTSMVSALSSIFSSRTTRVLSSAHLMSLGGDVTSSWRSMRVTVGVIPVPLVVAKPGKKISR